MWEQMALLEAWQSQLPGLVGDFYELPTVKGLQGLLVDWQCDK
jgi:hypothetical protein